MENSNKIQETISIIQNKIAHCKKNIENLCATTRFKEDGIEKRISILIHNNQLYLGFFDSNNNHKISFIEEDALLQRKEFVNRFSVLEQNVLDAINRYERNQEQILINKQMQEKWKEAIPMLDKIQQIDKELRNLPEKEYDRIHHTLQYDDFVSELINRYEELDTFEMSNFLNNTPNPFIAQVHTKQNSPEKQQFLYESR